MSVITTQVVKRNGGCGLVFNILGCNYCEVPFHINPCSGSDLLLFCSAGHGTLCDTCGTFLPPLFPFQHIAKSYQRDLFGPIMGFRGNVAYSSFTSSSMCSTNFSTHSLPRYIFNGSGTSP